eukprot:15267100-Ditylum_brightwellii.AAC.1
MQRFSFHVIDVTNTLICNTGASASVSYNTSDFYEGIQLLLQKNLADLSEQTQVKMEGKVWWRLLDDYGRIKTIVTW